MIQGNVNIDGDLIIEQPLDNYDGTVKYAINDSNGNPLTEYPSSDEYDNFSLECKWNVFSTKDIGIDNTNNEFNVNTVTYGNGICIITFINSKYIAQSLDYGDTWDLIDMGYVATRTSKFIIDTHFIIDYKRIYKLKEGEKFISSNNDITPSDLSFNDKESLIASDNNTNTLMVYTIYTSDTLKFDVKLNDDIIKGDRETIGLDINDNIKIKSVIFDTNLNKFVILNNTNKLILVDLEKNITSVNLTEEFDYMINTGAKQIFASKDKKYILYTNDMNEFNKIDLSYDEKWTNLKYVNGVYFLLTEKSEYILVSKDGIKWKYISELPIVSTWVDIIYKNNTYYLLDNKSNIITYNGDDITAKNITFDMEKVSKEVVSKNIYNYDNIFIITCEENKICVKKDSKWEIISNDNLGKNIIYYLNKNIYIFNGINKTNKLILSGVTNNYIDNTISGNTDSKYCIDFGKTEKKIGFLETTLPSDSSWRSVCYGNDKFVTVAGNSSNKVAYSTDGINWTATTLPSSADWRSVCYGNDKFVATAEISNKAAYSTDGINWTAATMPSSAEWKSVCYGNGKFVAVVYSSNKAAYSTDGIHWTAATLPSYANWISVCYGNDKYVTVTYGNSNKAAYSTDGINWTETTLPSSANWESVCYGNGKFVAVAWNSNTAAYSTDGITWNAATLPSNINWRSVCYGNDKFVAVAANNDKAVYSIDGINWTQATLPASAYWISVCYGNGKFITVNYDKAAYSTDLFINSYYLSKLNSSNLYLLTDNIESSTNQISDPYTLSIGDNNVIKDIVRSKNKSLLVTSDNTKLSIFNIIDKNNNITTSLIDDMNTINTINNPIMRYGRGSFVTVNKSSSETFIIDLFDNINHYNNSNDILNSDKIIDMKFINGLFLAIGTNSLFYSDFGFNWHMKSIIDTTDMELNENNLSGSIIYIPDKQRLLIINTSYKDKSYVAIYDNLIGMVKHFNDANYSLFDIYSHVKKLLDISVIDE